MKTMDEGSSKDAEAEAGVETSTDVDQFKCLLDMSHAECKILNLKCLQDLSEAECQNLKWGCGRDWDEAKCLKKIKEDTKLLCHTEDPLCHCDEDGTERCA